MNPISPKTFNVLKYVLDQQLFSQRMIARNLDVSLGQVNKVIHWLEDNNFIEKIRKKFLTDAPDDIGFVRYQLINPTGILRAISFFRSMKKNLLLEKDLDMKKGNIIEYLANQKMVFCLDTALEKYDSYFRGDTICCYITSPKEIERIKTKFNSIKYGLTRVKIYSWDFKGIDIGHYLNSKDNFTTELQTIIDLFCDNKPHYTKELLKRKWGIEL